MLAIVWHYWLGLILLVVGVLTVVAMGAGYLAKVTSMRYPNRRQRRSAD